MDDAGVILEAHRLITGARVDLSGVTAAGFALQNAQNAYQASQAGSPLAVFGALTQGIGNLGTAYRGFNSPYGG
mgnify:CR=1 FL=1